MGRHGSKNAFFFCGIVFGIVVAIGLIIMAVGNLIDDRNYPYQYPFKVPNTTTTTTTPTPNNSTTPPPPPPPPGGSSNDQPPAVIINMAGLVVSDNQGDDNAVDLCHEEYFLPLDGNPIDASPPPPAATRLRWTTHFYLDGLVTIPPTIRRINTTHDDTLLSVLLVLDLAEKETPDPTSENYHPKGLVFNTNENNACGDRLMNCNVNVIINTTERPLIISSSDRLDPLVVNDNNNNNDNLLFRFYYSINRAQLLRLSDAANPTTARLFVFATYVATPVDDNDHQTTASPITMHDNDNLTCTLDADCMTNRTHYATTQLIEERFIRIPDVLCSARPIVTTSP